MFELPEELKPFFWDTDDVNPIKHKFAIIERLMKFGTHREIKWMLGNYTQDDIIEVVKKSRSIDKITANFWMIYYKLDEKDILCLNRSYQNECFYN